MKKFFKKIKLPLAFTTLSPTVKLMIGMTCGILVVMGGAFVLAKSLPAQKGEVAQTSSTYDVQDYALAEPEVATVSTNTVKHSSGNVSLVEATKPDYTAPAYIPTTTTSASTETDIPDYMPSAQKKGAGTTVDTTTGKSTSTSSKKSSGSSTSGPSRGSTASKTASTPSKTSGSTSGKSGLGNSSSSSGSSQPHMHSYSKEVTKKATCEEDGLYTFRCMCGITYTEKIEKTGHTWGAWKTTKEATCSDKGEQKRTCSVCSKEESKEIDRLSHSFGDWSVVSAPTCAAEGKEQRVCKNCNTKEARSIAKLAHTWNDVIVKVAPTCYSEGTGTHTCTVCGTTANVTLNKIDHTTTNWTVDAPATCTEDGVRHANCDVCGELVTEKLEATGHTGWNWITKEEPTCTKDGYKRRDCSVCGAYEIETLPKHGHSSGTPVRTVITAATCTENGSYTETISCTRCGEKIEEITGVIPATGHYYVNGECINCHEQESQQ